MSLPPPARDQRASTVESTDLTADPRIRIERRTRPTPTDPPAATEQPRPATPSRSASAKQTWYLPDAPRAALAILCALTISFVARAGIDPDLFWHLATGRHIVRTGAIPSTDPFSWTVPGRSWIAHEWLSELAMYPLFDLTGMRGLALLYGLVVAGALVATHGAARRRGAGPWASVAAAAAVALTSAHTFAVRPQMLSLMFTAVAALLVADLEHLTTPKATRRLLALAAVLALWVNLHGGYIFGVALAGLTIATRTLADLRSGNRRDAVRLWPGGLACLAAVLLNPNTIDGLIYPFTYLGDNASTRYVAEWVAPSISQPQYWPLFALVATVVVVTLLALAGRTTRRIRATELVLIVPFTVLALDAVRNTGPFAVICAPIIASLVTRARERKTTGVPRAKGIVHLVAVVGMIAAVAPGAVAATTTARVDDRIAAEFPVAEADLVASLGPGVRMINAYDWGGYLIWRLHPTGVYVDGRPDMYGDPFVDRFISTWRAEPGWAERLDDPQVDVVLVESRSGLGTAIADAPAWRVVSRTDRAIVAVRRGSAADSKTR